MEVNKAEIDAVLDAQGRFVWTPNALTLDGQRNVPCDLQDGESLDAFLRRHVSGIDSGAWSVSIGGAMVPRAMWAKTFPKHGMLIACRATVGKQVVQLVAIAALSYFTLGMGGIAAGSFLGLTGAAGWAAAMGVFVAGSLLINKVLGPKVPKAGDAPAARQVYSLSGQRNSARAYEPVPVLFGEMRVTPDLASQPWGFYEGDNQYLNTNLLGGINVGSASDLSIGDTPLSSYADVEQYFNGFSGMPSDRIPLRSNMDTLPGGELPDSRAWVARTSSVGALGLGLDFEYQLYEQGTTGLKSAKATITAQYRAVGTSTWQPLFEKTFGNGKADVRRWSKYVKVEEGQYEVRVRRENGPNSSPKVTRSITWSSLRTAQADPTDYSQFGRIGLTIKATGQISGSLDTVRATYRAKPMPIWNGTAWATATNRDNGLSNPGAIILLALRGIWHKGKLQFGFGLMDDQIDIEGLKAFMLHCAAKGYTYDRWITSNMSLGDFCQEVALAGMGEFSWTDGSRPTVVFVSAGQPVSAVVNMANMLKGSFSVDYALNNAADGIEYQYVDRTKNYETVTLRVSAPGVATVLNPARITGEGVTTEAHAAVMARYHLAQSLYQYKTVGFGADIEHLDYRRLSLLSVSHDLTQWGFGGRLEAIAVGNGYVQVHLGEAVPALTTPKLGLRLPGDRDYRVWPVQEFAGESDTLILLGDWPEGVPVPGDTEADPVHDTLWCYDFKATPGYRVRVTGVEPEGDLKGAKVTCVPEGPEFWDYVLNGTYEPAPNQSSLPQLARPVATNLRVQEQTNVQGNTQWWELSAVWDVDGAAHHSQVWAGLDGSELTLVDAQALANRTSFRINEPGEYLVQVRPFDASGRAGDAASVLYVTAGVDVPPVNASNFAVQELAGGLRRFAWSFAGDLPAAFAGVQIRYSAGDVAASADSWTDMVPLGDVDDIYTAQFETTKPAAGVYTFALRTVNTSGQLSVSVLRFVANLSSSFEQLQQPDLTPPPAPSNVRVAPLVTTAQVIWDEVIYSVGRGHKHSIVYVARVQQGMPLPTLGQAKSVLTTGVTPCSIPVDMGAEYLLWVRNVSNDGVLSAASEPVQFVTAQDVAQLLDLLAGKVGPDALTPDVRDELSKIGGIAADLAGVQMQVADILAAQAYDPLLAYVEGALVTDGGKLYRAMQAVPAGVAPPAAAYWQYVGDYASLGEAVVAHSIQLQSVAVELDELGRAVSASASSVSEMRAMLRDEDPNAFLADVLNQWDSHASITEERLVRATNDEAEAQARLQLAAQMDDGFAAVTQQFSAQADINGHQAAKYALAVTVGQGGDAVVGGMQISGTNSAQQGPKVAIQFATDAFKIVSTDGGLKTTPFYVQTKPTTVNGVVVPAGVYMDSASIGNVTALWGRFGTLVADSIQATAISASQLTAGNGVIGGTLKSGNYVAGSSGWALRPDGVAEFSGVIVRGTVYATSGTVGGWSIGIDHLRSSNFQSGVRGVSLGSNGTVEIRSTDGTRVFNLQASGTQQLLAVPGLEILGNGSAVFSGHLGVGAIDVVDTVNIKDGAVTVTTAASEDAERSYAGTSETEVYRMSATYSAGARNVLLAACTLRADLPSTASRLTVSLYRGDTMLRRIYVYGRNYPGGSYVYDAVALPPVVDSPPAGVQTYRITVEGGAVNVSRKSIVSMGFKR